MTFGSEKPSGVRTLGQAVLATFDQDEGMTSGELERRLKANEQRRRAEEGTALRPKVIERFQIATGDRLEDDTEFLSVPESDLLVEAAFARVKETTRSAEWHELSALALDALDGFAAKVGDARLYLSAAETHFTGLPRVPAAPLLRHVDGFWMPEQEDLMLLSRDAADGIFLEWCDHRVELRTWGWPGTLIG